MLYSKLEEQAINQALTANWQAALDLNLQILKKAPKDIDALCRLAKTYTELNKKQLALKTYKKVLKLDRFNQIAKKNLVKFSKKASLKKKGKNSNNNLVRPDLFLEEPGRTKVVSLIKLCQSKILLSLNINSPVKLVSRKRSISVYDQGRRYLGKIPDDLSLRLIKLIKSGNQYQAVIKSVDEKNLSIFIKEIKRGKKNISIPSFPLSKDQYYSFVPAAMVKREPIQEIEKPEE